MSGRQPETAIDPFPRHDTKFMTIICAWCREIIGFKVGRRTETTHSICPACVRRLKPHDRHATYRR